MRARCLVLVRVSIERISEQESPPADPSILLEVASLLLAGPSAEGSVRLADKHGHTPLDHALKASGVPGAMIVLIFFADCTPVRTCRKAGSNLKTRSSLPRPHCSAF